MGFFSSIGDFIGDAVGGLADGLGISDAIGFVSDFAGDILGTNAAKEQAKANAEASLQAAKINTAYQKEFAQNGIRWRVDDAKEAGLHPLAALGAQTATYSPSYSMDAFSSDKSSSLGNALHSLGQNVSRARMAKMQQEDRSLENAWKAAQIKRLEADTALAQAQASKMAVDSQQLPPAMPKVNGKAKLDIKNNPDNAKDMFTLLVNHRGERELYPTEAYYQIFEEKPFGVDMAPLLQAGGINLAARLGIIDEPVRANGRWYIFDSKANSWLPYDPSSRRGSISVEYPKRKPNYDRWANIH